MMCSPGATLGSISCLIMRRLALIDSRFFGAFACESSPTDVTGSALIAFATSAAAETVATAGTTALTAGAAVEAAATAAISAAG